MLHLVLAALVVGAPVDGDRDGDKKSAAPAPAQTESTSPIFRTGFAPSETAVEAGQAESVRIASALGADESITNDTYAFGRPQEGTYLKIWTSYAWGQIEDMYNAAGEDAVPYTITRRVDRGDGQLATIAVPAVVTTQRFLAGAQINPLDFRQFKLGGGAQGIFAKNEISAADGATGTADFSAFESDFALQSLKVFGVIEGKTLGLHGGYVFDFGDESGRDESGNFNSAANSAEQDAWFAGASFDMPLDWVRLFGGIDYYGMKTANHGNDGVQLLVDGLDASLESILLQQAPRAVTQVPVDAGNDLIFFNFGAGFQLSFFEIGASAILRTQLERTAAADELYAAAVLPGAVGSSPTLYAASIYGSRELGIPDSSLPGGAAIQGTRSTAAYPSGGHHGSIVPYLIVRPPNLPVALSVRGAVTNQFGDYGFSLGGANDFVTREGFTVALSYGF